MCRDVPFDEETPERAESGGAWSHVSPLTEVEAARERWVRDFDARAALADLRALLDMPLPTRATRERLLGPALVALSRIIEPSEHAHARSLPLIQVSAPTRMRP